MTDHRLLSWEISITFLTSLTVNNIGHFKPLELSREMFAIMEAERKLTVERLETDFTGETLVLISLQVRNDHFLHQVCGVLLTGGETEAGYLEAPGQILHSLTGDLLAGGASLEELQEGGESPGVGVGEEEGGGEAGREGEEAGEERAGQSQ